MVSRPGDGGRRSPRIPLVDSAAHIVAGRPSSPEASESPVSTPSAILQGYLSEEEILDSAAFVPAAPEADSPVQALDTAWAERMHALRGTPRWDMAIRDADLSFPAATDAFSCALGFEITEENTPGLYLLLWRSLADIALSSYSAKIAYQRERPFMVNIRRGPWSGSLDLRCCRVPFPRQQLVQA